MVFLSGRTIRSLVGRGCAASDAVRSPDFRRPPAAPSTSVQSPLRATPALPSGADRERARRRPDRRSKRVENGRRPSDRRVFLLFPPRPSPLLRRLSRPCLPTHGKYGVNENRNANRPARPKDSSLGPKDSSPRKRGSRDPGQKPPESAEEPPLARRLGSVCRGRRPRSSRSEAPDPARARRLPARKVHAKGGAGRLPQDSRRRPRASARKSPSVGPDPPFGARVVPGRCCPIGRPDHPTACRASRGRPRPQPGRARARSRGPDRGRLRTRVAKGTRRRTVQVRPLRAGVRPSAPVGSFVRRAPAAARGPRDRATLRTRVRRRRQPPRTSERTAVQPRTSAANGSATPRARSSGP